MAGKGRERLLGDGRWRLDTTRRRCCIVSMTMMNLSCTSIAISPHYSDQCDLFVEPDQL